MPAKLRRAFFARSVHEVAPELIGATLFFRDASGTIKLYPRPKRVRVVIGSRVGLTKAVKLPCRYGLRDSRFLTRPFEE